MLICPNCQTALKTDFGYETCSKCGTVVFIDLDGTVVPHDPNSSMALEVESEGDIISGNTISTDSSTDIQETDDITGHEFGFTDEAIGNLSVSQPIEDEEYTADDPLDGFEDLEASTEDSVDDLESHELNGAAGTFGDLNEAEQSSELGEPAPVEDAMEPNSEDGSDIDDETLDIEIDDGSGNEYVVTTADDFLDEMQMFGEIDSDKFKESIYFFDIEIAGIDSKDIRDSVVMALEDSKLNLTVDNLNQLIVGGMLVLKSVSAVKAHVVIQRISHLPCEISWTLIEVQDLATDPSGYEESNASLVSDSEEDSADEFDEFA